MTPKERELLGIATSHLFQAASALRELSNCSGTDLHVPAETSKGADVKTPNAILATEETLNARECAAIFGVSERTLRRWVRGKKVLRPVRIGNTLRWKRTAVELWMKERAK